MKSLFQENYKKIIGFTLIGIHFIGTVVSFFIFSYQYIRDYGFLNFLFWGEVEPLFKSTVWEVFLILALIQSPSQSPTTNLATEQALSQLQNLWWQSEYPTLVKFVDAADNSTISTSYRTGPSGGAKVKLTLVRKAKGGLILRVDLPPQAIVSVDPKRGERTPSRKRPVMTIRDHNEDGVPDDFNMEPHGTPLYKEDVAEDGFIKFRSGTDHRVIWINWSVGIGFSVNHFLHGIESAMPRR